MDIAIIGCGNMGRRIAEKLATPLHHIFLHDRHWDKTVELTQKIKGIACQSVKEAIKPSQLIFLAIKPQNLNEIIPFLKESLKTNQILVSLLAGISTSMLKTHFPNIPLVRMMPNLALSHGKGVIGVVDSPELSNELKEELQCLFSPLGFVYWLKESQLDALTSLTGSGPAFIFTFIEAMIEAGVSMGFQAKDAYELILYMLDGSVALLQNSHLHPGDLKWQIASPNGTTIAGLRTLEKENVRSGIIETFLTAYQKARELSSHYEKEMNF